MHKSTTDIPSADLWYRIDLSKEDYEGGEADVIESAFRQIYIASNAPAGMAMLSASSPINAGYCIYFTPRSQRHAAALIRAYSAKAENLPRGASQRMVLRVGDPSSVSDYWIEC